MPAGRYLEVYGANKSLASIPSNNVFYLAQCLVLQAGVYFGAIAVFPDDASSRTVIHTDMRGRDIGEIKGLLDD
ncbi:MAG: hypothetical protein WD077_02950 [Bacteroidia bacterium]